MGKIVCNSSCFIALERIGRLDILKHSFRQIIIPQAVAREIDLNLDWVTTKLVKNRQALKILNTQLGDGEAEVIALSLELSNILVLLDDKKARRIATQLNLPIIGTIGLILRAKRIGLIPEVKPILNELHKNGFRIKESVYKKALSLAQED